MQGPETGICNRGPWEFQFQGLREPLASPTTLPGILDYLYLLLLATLFKTKIKNDLTLETMICTFTKAASVHAGYMTGVSPSRHAHHGTDFRKGRVARTCKLRYIYNLQTIKIFLFLFNHIL